MDAERLDRARAALKIMAERFPRAFTDPPRPLKVGVTKDLIPAVRETSALGPSATRSRSTAGGRHI
jgi:sRNA-binding protein